MAKLKLNPDPTFDAVVDIPVHGTAAVAVKFKFKHRSKSAIKEWIEEAKSREDADVILDTAEGWELDDEFNRENVERLLDNYAGSGPAIFEAYLRELSQARTKN